MGDTDNIFIRSATNDDCEAVQELVFGVLHEYGLNPDLRGIDKDISDIEAHYLNRGGVFELLEDAEGKLLGTLGLYPIDEQRIELRKMYFLEEIRGRGLGKATLTRMLETAKSKGFSQVVLETASVLKEAIGLYTKFGFVESGDQHTPRCDKSFYLDMKKN